MIAYLKHTRTGKRHIFEGDKIYTLRLLLIAGTNFSEFSGDQKNR